MDASRPEREAFGLLPKKQRREFQSSPTMTWPRTCGAKVILDCCGEGAAIHLASQASAFMEKGGKELTVKAVVF